MVARSELAWSAKRVRACAIAGPLLIIGGCGGSPVTGPVVADRPGYTDTPTALPARGYQVEAGITDDHVDSVTYRSAGEVLVRAGVGSHIELRFFGNSYGIRWAPGWKRRMAWRTPSWAQSWRCTLHPTPSTD